MQKSAGAGVEFSLVAQTKYHHLSVTAIQERHLDSAVQFFPLTLIHFKDLPGMESATLPAGVVNGKAGRHTHTHWGLLH